MTMTPNLTYQFVLFPNIEVVWTCSNKTVSIFIFLTGVFICFFDTRGVVFKMAYFIPHSDFTTLTDTINRCWLCFKPVALPTDPVFRLNVENASLELEIDKDFIVTIILYPLSFYAREIPFDFFEKIANEKKPGSTFPLAKQSSNHNVAIFEAPEDPRNEPWKTQNCSIVLTPQSTTTETLNQVKKIIKTYNTVVLTYTEPVPNFIFDVTNPKILKVNQLIFSELIKP